MERPIAFKMLPGNCVEVHRMRTEPLSSSAIEKTLDAPAVVVARKATMLPELGTGIVDMSDILVLKEGDWSNAILVLVSDIAPALLPSSAKHSSGDDRFLQSVNDIAPELLPLSRKAIALIRSAGVGGELVEKTKGRWVNAPLNSFTLKVQPRAGNIQFTLYGNPSSFDADGFLLQDQNSYSRGWVKNESDAHRLAALVKQSYARRSK